MKTVQLSIANVEVQDVLTWGLYQKMSLTGAKLLKMDLGESEVKKAEINAEGLYEMRVAQIQILVQKITTKDGQVVPCTQEWISNLSIEDGDKLYAEVQQVLDAKKK